MPDSFAELGQNEIELGADEAESGRVLDRRNKAALGQNEVELGADVAELGTVIPDAVIARPELAAVVYRSSVPSFIIGIRVPVARVNMTGRMPSLRRRLPVRPGQLILSGRAPSVGTGFSPGLGRVTITGRSPRLGLLFPVAAGRITVRAFAPLIQIRFPVPVARLSFVGNRAVLNFDHIARPDVGGNSCPKSSADYSFAMFPPSKYCGPDGPYQCQSGKHTRPIRDYPEQ